MVGVVRAIAVDGKTYVDVEDYQRLLKMYEDAVGAKTNEQIIAELGEDEVPDDKPANGCKGCKFEYATFQSCAVCSRTYVDRYTIKK